MASYDDILPTLYLVPLFNEERTVWLKRAHFSLRPWMPQIMEILIHIQTVLFIGMQLTKGVTCLPDSFNTPVIAHKV